jgi:hypothetical protein
MMYLQWVSARNRAFAKGGARCAPRHKLSRWGSVLPQGWLKLGRMGSEGPKAVVDDVVSTVLRVSM